MGYHPSTNGLGNNSFRALNELYKPVNRVKDHSMRGRPIFYLVIKPHRTPKLIGPLSVYFWSELHCFYLCPPFSIDQNPEATIKNIRISYNINKLIIILYRWSIVTVKYYYHDFAGLLLASSYTYTIEWQYNGICRLVSCKVQIMKHTKQLATWKSCTLWRINRHAHNCWRFMIGDAMEVSFQHLHLGLISFLCPPTVIPHKTSCPSNLKSTRVLIQKVYHVASMLKLRQNQLPIFY